MLSIVILNGSSNMRLTDGERHRFRQSEQRPLPTWRERVDLMLEVAIEDLEEIALATFNAPVVGLMAVVAGWLYVVFKKKNWL